MDEKMDGVIPLSIIMDVQAEISSGIGSGLTPKGVVESASDLPATGEVGDMYLVSDEGYATYVWDDVKEKYAPKRNDAATVEEYMAAIYS